MKLTHHIKDFDDIIDSGLSLKECIEKFQNILSGNPDAEIQSESCDCDDCFHEDWKIVVQREETEGEKAMREATSRRIENVRIEGEKKELQRLAEKYPDFVKELKGR